MVLPQVILRTLIILQSKHAQLQQNDTNSTNKRLVKILHLPSHTHSQSNHYLQVNIGHINLY